MSAIPVTVSSGSKISIGDALPSYGLEKTVQSSWKERIFQLNPLRWITKADLPNPGLLEDFSKEVMDTRIEQYQFDGAKVAFSRSHNQGFHSSHSFMMGSAESPNMYQLNTIFANEKLFMQASLDNQNSRSGIVKYSVTEKCKATLRITSSPRMNMMATEVDYLNKSSTVQFKVTNMDPFTSSAVLYGGYLRHITPTIMVGAEGVSNIQQGTAHDFNNTLLVGKKNADDAYFLRIMPGAVNLAYYKKVHDRVHLVADLTGGMHSQSMITDLTLAAKFDFRASVFRASLNTNGIIAAHLEHNMAPGVAFLMSGEIDHRKDAGRFGFGFQLGH